MFIKAPLLHQSFGPRVCLSFFPFFLSLSHFLTVDSGPPGSGLLKDQHSAIKIDEILPL